MVRKLILMLMASIFLFSSVSAGLALDMGNKRKGKYTYRKVYNACFERGEVESKTPPLSPADKTQAEWKQIFEENDFDQFGCLEEWEKLTEKDISDIYAYLYAHAADSPTPAKCK